MNTKKVYASGELGDRSEAISMEIKGKEGTLADDGVLTTEFGTVGMYLVSVGDDSAIVAVTSIAGTVATELVTTNANITLVEDTDAKANVYIDSDVLVVQNKLGQSEDVTVKAYL